VVVDKKARALVKMTKTWQFRQPALPRAFPGEKHEIARAFYVKYDQNYGLRTWTLLEDFFLTFHDMGMIQSAATI
jgi:hypothetical protein